MTKSACNAVVSPPWLDKFRTAIERYYQNRPEDRFRRDGFSWITTQVDEPMWRMARSGRQGGYCYPPNPQCVGWSLRLSAPSYVVIATPQP